MFCVNKKEFVIAKDTKGGVLVVFDPSGRKGHGKSVVPNVRFRDAIEVRAGGKPRDSGQWEGTVGWGLDHAFLFENPSPVSEIWVVVRPEGSFRRRIE